MKTKRAIGFELSRLTDEQLIIIGHLTYHAGKLWNQANYLVQNRLAKPHYKDLYHKLKDSSIKLRSLHSRSAQIVLDELSRAWNNICWRMLFKMLNNLNRFSFNQIDTNIGIK